MLAGQRKAHLLGLLAGKRGLAGLDADHGQPEVGPAGAGGDGIEERRQGGGARIGGGGRADQGREEPERASASHSASFALAYWSRARTKTGLKRPSRAPE